MFVCPFRVVLRLAVLGWSVQFVSNPSTILSSLPLSLQAAKQEAPKQEASKKEQSKQEANGQQQQADHNGAAKMDTSA